MENYSSVPKEFVLGDTLTIELDGGDYPAPDYSRRIVFVSATDKQSFDSTDSGTGHLLTIDTSLFSAGRYDYQLKANGDVATFTKTVASGFITFVTDFSAAGVTAHDGRDWRERAIDALQAAIEGRADKSQLTQKVGNTEVQHMSLEQQLAAKRELLREKAIAAGKIFTTIRPRFRN